MRGDVEQIETLKTQLKSFGAANEDLQKEVTFKSQENDKFRHEYDLLSREKNSYGEQNDQLRDECDTLRHQLPNLMQENEKLKRDLQI